MRVVINRCYGGFGLSDLAYEKLIEWGVPVRKYIEQVRSPETGLHLPEPRNEGEVIFDRELTLPGECSFTDIYHKYKGCRSALTHRYWETWISGNRSHPLLLRLMDELGSEVVSGQLAELKVVEIPDGIEWELDEYDGIERINETHRSWS